MKKEDVKKTHKAARTLRKLKQINPWAIGTIITLLVVFIVLGYFGYMKAEAGRLQRELQEKQNVLNAKNKEYKSYVDQDLYRKREAANLIHNQGERFAWKETINDLITLYKDLISLDEKLPDIELTDFRVTIDYDLDLRGNIEDIENMYGRNGFLKRLQDEEYIEFVNIPFYKKDPETGGYSFILQAKLQSYEGN